MCLWDRLLFYSREGHFIKLATLGVQGRNLALLLAGYQALGCSVTMDPTLQGCPSEGILYCGDRRHLGAVDCSGPGCPAAPRLLAGACWRFGGSPPSLLVPIPCHPWVKLSPVI